MANNNSTPHIEGGNIARVVLMPGDPLRAKHVAETYLENPVCFNTTRNMFGYTGTYNGKEISVMGSGMGIPSMALYATELFDNFEVDAIIRIGTAGALSEEAELRDIVIAMAASSDSNYGATYGLPGYLSPVCNYEMLKEAVDSAAKLGHKAKVGTVFTSDHFYDPLPGTNEKARELGHLAVEMETAGLYWTALGHKKKALSILTISDHILKGESLSAKDRQESFHEMMEVALETAWRCTK